MEFCVMAKERTTVELLREQDQRNGTFRQADSRRLHQRHEPASDRPKITVSTEEHEVNAEAVTALTRDTTIYQRGGLIVRVERDGSPAAAGVRRPFAPRIAPLPREILRERLTAVATWMNVRETNNGVQESPAHPPG